MTRDRSAVTALRYEPIDLRHEAEIQRLAGDPRIAEMTTIPHPYPPGGARRWIDAVMQRRAAGLEHAFAMIDGDFIGLVALTEIGREPATAEWGSWVDPIHWREGYAERGGHFIARVAFFELGLHRLVAQVRSKNFRSQTLPYKLGFRWTHTRTHDGDVFHHYELLAGDYRAPEGP